MQRFTGSLFFVGVLFYVSQLLADNTAGSMLHVNSSKFNHPNLTQLTWAAEISEYEYASSAVNPFRLRIEFNSIGFMGNGSSYPYCYVGSILMNLSHSFADDIAGSQFGSNPTITSFPGVGLYLSSLQTTWSDSSHGLRLLANPAMFPMFGRVFENIDNMGYTGKNIYTRQPIGTPSLSTPLKVRWTVSRVGIVVNPQDSLSRNLAGTWMPLRGTFVIWNFKIEINGVTFDVANYYLPIEKAEYIWAWDPLVLHQEYFGAKEGILNGEKGSVKYVDMRASDGIKWYNLEDWQITWRIDDGGGNRDNRFGWKSDGKSLTSRVGHDDDSTQCSRDVSVSFKIALPLTSVNSRLTLGPRYFVLLQNYPNPFNPSTTIQFSIPNTSFVSLKVFSVLGAEIATLANENKAPGTYQVTWDAKGYPSGMYLYRLIAGGKVFAGKMNLLK